MAIVTTGILSATASPQYESFTPFEAQTNCGDTAWVYRKKDKLVQYALTGELTYFDHEAMYLLFGGDVVTGRAGTGFPGNNIGWAAPGTNDPAGADLYLEFITKVAGAGADSCDTSLIPAAVGHIFPNVSLIAGDRTFDFDAAVMTFSGTSRENSNAFNGPWGDWPGVGAVPVSPYIQVSYSAAEYDAIMATAACGFTLLPGAHSLQSDAGEDLLADDGASLYVQV
ncbi:hypothetical protein [Gemmatimonas sp.]|uniref:hypothetical protein n=1 Tax=Gemmatimonas sp. TaxID=1962908 RepID=UPI003568AB1C